MPHYSYEKTFTAGKSKTTQEELEMSCHWGILCDITISWRAGTDRQTHVHIDDGLHQIYPTNPKGDYAFDDYTLRITGEYELTKGTRKLYLRGWNTGVHDHEVAVTFRIKIPERLSIADKALVKLVKMFERFIGV